MRAITFQGVGRIVHEYVPDPVLCEPTDALVDVDLCALCGSDLHPFRGHEKGLDVGTVMGHEFLGEIVAVGAAVEHLAVGDRVVSPFTTSCGACFYCQRGLTARCERGQLFGWVEDGRGLPGAQAERVRVPLAETTLVRVPPGARDDEALLAGDVLSTGFFCAQLGECRPGAVVAVIGAGPVGLCAAIRRHRARRSRRLRLRRDPGAARPRRPVRRRRLRHPSAQPPRRSRRYDPRPGRGRGSRVRREPRRHRQRL